MRGGAGRCEARRCDPMRGDVALKWDGSDPIGWDGTQECVALVFSLMGW